MLQNNENAGLCLRCSLSPKATAFRNIFSQRCFWHNICAARELIDKAILKAIDLMPARSVAHTRLANDCSVGMYRQLFNELLDFACGI